MTTVGTRPAPPAEAAAHAPPARRRRVRPARVALAIALPALLVALPCLLGPVLVQVRTGHKKRERRFWCLSIYLHGCSRPVGGIHTHTTTNTKQK